VLILASMLMNTIQALRAAGLAVDQVNLANGSDRDAPDAVIEVRAGTTTARFAVEQKMRAPYPNELPRFDAPRKALLPVGQPLLVGPFVSEALATSLTAADWSWADEQGNFDLRAPGLLLRQRRMSAAPKPKRTRLPQGSGGLAIVRALIRFGEGDGEGFSATGLANQAGVSQPRASQVLGQLHNLGLVEKSARGRWVPRREELLDRFLTEYRGPGGSERYLYSLESPTEVAARAAIASSESRPIAVSADVGPDLLASWRRPSTVILYANHDVDIGDLGLVDAQGPHDANVILRAPADQSVFRDRVLLARVGAVDITIADETQLIWDLEDLGGADRLEAAGRMREWLLTHP
jgi:hypothetical protein